MVIMRRPSAKLILPKVHIESIILSLKLKETLFSRSEANCGLITQLKHFPPYRRIYILGREVQTSSDKAHDSAALETM